MFAHGAWVHKTSAPDDYELLVIDTGEAAFLPKRMTVSKDGAERLISQFSNAVMAASAISGLIAKEMGGTNSHDDGGSVTGASDADSEFIVQDNVPDR